MRQKSQKTVDRQVLLLYNIKCNCRYDGDCVEKERGTEIWQNKN